MAASDLFFVDGRRMRPGDKLGSGTFGVVFEAIDADDAADAAAKRYVFKYQKHGPEGFDCSAIREMAYQQKLSSLKHPHIMALCAYFCRPCGLYMVFERMRGDLHGCLHRDYHGDMPVEQVASCMRQLFCALDFCHGLGVVHRDVKPQNVLIDDRGVVKLGDLGCARSLTAGRCASPQPGTLWYRAPEVLLGADEYGSGIDVWACGCVLWELAVGSPLAPGDSEIGQIMCIFEVFGTPKVRTLPEMNRFEHIEFPRWSRRIPLHDKLTGVLFDVFEECTLYEWWRRCPASAAFAQLRDAAYPIAVVKPRPRKRRRGESM